MLHPIIPVKAEVDPPIPQFTILVKRQLAVIVRTECTGTVFLLHRTFPDISLEAESGGIAVLLRGKESAGQQPDGDAKAV